MLPTPPATRHNAHEAASPAAQPCVSSAKQPLPCRIHRLGLGCGILGLGLTASLGLATDAQAKLDLPSIFADHMVLQRNQPIHVWGWTDPNQAVTVELAGTKPWQTKQGPTTLESRSVTVQADGQGRFDAYLDPIAGAGHYNFTATAGTDAVAYKDVLIGEVWFCSGQSNMQWEVRESDNAASTIAAADQPAIRLFNVPRAYSLEPLQDVPGVTWTHCTPETVPNFSAVGYNFGLYLQEALDAPVGLIHSSWGGTPAESWTRWESMANNPITAPIVEMALDMRALTDHPGEHVDPGLTENDAQFAQPGFDDSDWQTLTLPSSIEKGIEDDLDGVIWFRTTVDLPANMVGKPLTVHLGPIDDTDTTYANGTPVGHIGQDRIFHWAAPREYTIPAEANNQKTLAIAVRMYDDRADGGFMGKPEQMFVTDGSTKLSLAKPWKYHIQHMMHGRDLWGQIPYFCQASTLYDGMVLPFAGYSMQGAIWYQGESNADRAKQYATLLPMMIEDWRRVWNQPGDDRDFAFGIVELATFMQPDPNPVEHPWAELREAQMQTAENDANTGIVSILDIGDANDIHPRNKHEVGRRLALWAQATQYGQNVVYQGPSVANVAFNNGQAIVTLKANDPAGLQKIASPIGGFAIAGDDHQFHWATVKQEGKKFVLTSPEVKNPVAVRYGWHANPWDGPHGGHIKNAAGLPMSPFRTDDWPGVTDNNRR